MTGTSRIYAYTLPDHASVRWTRTVAGTTISGVGKIKVGQTTRESAARRIKEQTGTAYPDQSLIKVFFDLPAVRVDGSHFSDHEVHRTLVGQGIHRAGEWFEATEEEVLAAVTAVRNGKAYASGRTMSFSMRPEQEAAVDVTAAYFREHASDSQAPRFLWNAKMRFGKTFTAYQLARELGWTKVLVLTYKPAVHSAWKDDLLSHTDFDDWQFADKTTALDELDLEAPIAWFSSLQDAMGKDVDGNVKQHNNPLHLLDWDCVIVDEYHFGAWRDAAKQLYDPTESALAEIEQENPLSDSSLAISARNRLFLSGTPFRALTDGEFSEDQIYNWTYIDEQKFKSEWDASRGANPYAALAGMEVYTYQLSQDAEAVAVEGEFNGFDLNYYFKATKIGEDYKFANETRVIDFLNMIRGKLTSQMRDELVAGTKPPFPFEDERFHGRVNHTVWYMADVAACFAMADLLAADPYFSDFAVRVAAGPRAGLGAAALPPVQQLIDHHDKTITLSCGKLMTGVTVPQWSAILMLRSLKSPESYFQAAFRVQSPWTTKAADGAVNIEKSKVFVFDFDPNRALQLVAEYGSKLATLGDTTPKEAINELINFLPIFAFDGSSMEQLDAGAVLDWATAGTGATMLARRWRDARLVDLNEAALTRLLSNEALVESLEQMEDFRNLSSEVSHIISSTKSLEKAKAANGGKTPAASKKQSKELSSKRKALRDKLLKFLSRVPVFMYLTDFREEALEHVITSLDPKLFERVTGLTIADFTALKEAGVFNAGHMNAAIYQFKLFEDSSLAYVNDRIGLWDHSVRRSDLDDMSAEEAIQAVEIGS